MLNSREKLEDRLINREQHNILTEIDRKKIRQTLNLHAENQREKQHKVKKKSIKISEKPNISEIVLHNEFKWVNYIESLDEIPYLFLFRIHLFPYLEQKSLLKLNKIQDLLLMSGFSNFTLTKVNDKVTRLSGDIDKGGTIKQVVLFLENVEEETFFINDCIFKALSN